MPPPTASRNPKRHDLPSRSLGPLRRELPRCLAAEVHRPAERIAHDFRLYGYQNRLPVCLNGVAIGEVLALHGPLERERLARWACDAPADRVAFQGERERRR